jgi:hypothetical protein
MLRWAKEHLKAQIMELGYLRMGYAWDTVRRMRGAAGTRDSRGAGMNESFGTHPYKASES